jgi:hypothetical protein
MGQWWEQFRAFRSEIDRFDERQTEAPCLVPARESGGLFHAEPDTRAWKHRSDEITPGNSPRVQSHTGNPFKSLKAETQNGFQAGTASDGTVLNSREKGGNEPRASVSRSIHNSDVGDRRGRSFEAARLDRNSLIVRDREPVFLGEAIWHCLLLYRSPSFDQKTFDFFDRVQTRLASFYSPD